jgi:diaminopimelate epimerase
MHGIGNDFVMVDCVNGEVPPVDPVALARKVCDRKFGVGADGLIYVEREGADLFRMRMWNPDGSESEMCGNGIRCVAKLLVDEGVVTEAEGRSGIPIETGAGRLVLEVLESGMVRVDMGKAWLTRGEIGMTGPSDEQFVSQDIGGGLNGSAVSMGNPHLVILVEDASKVDLNVLGPRLEHHELFPARTNVHFVQVVDRGHLIQRTWERGAGATLACGTGACASAVASFLNGGSDRNVEIDLPGGRLKIEYAEDGRVFMTGPAETVYDGESPL